MWWKLGSLATLTTVLIFILVTPLFTIQVKVDVPPGVTPLPADQVQAVGSAVAIAADAVVVVLVFAGSFWLWRRIVRRHRTGPS